MHPPEPVRDSHRRCDRPPASLVRQPNASRLAQPRNAVTNTNTDTTLDVMADTLCSAGGAAHTHDWCHSANHSATPASWIAAGGSHTGDKRVHAWASTHEQGPHWVQPAFDTGEIACPRACQHVAVEIMSDQTELEVDSSSWFCAMDEAELQRSVDLYLPEAAFTMTDLNSSSNNFSCSTADGHADPRSTTPVSVGLLPTASFSLLGAVGLLQSQQRSEPQPAPAAQRRRKRVSISTFSVVREFQPTGVGPSEAASTWNCCYSDEKERGKTHRDVCSTTHTEDGPRAENLLLDRLIITHFEGWALTNPGAIAEFVGGDAQLRQVGPGLIDRLEEMICSLDSGTVQHVGVLPSCVRMGLSHLPHLRTLHTWVTASFQHVSSSFHNEGGDGEHDSATDGVSAHDDAANASAQHNQMDQDEVEMGW